MLNGMCIESTAFYCVVSAGAHDGLNAEVPARHRLDLCV